MLIGSILPQWLKTNFNKVNSLNQKDFMEKIERIRDHS